MVPIPDWAMAPDGGRNTAVATTSDADGNIYVVGMMGSATLTLGNIQLTRITTVNNQTDMLLAKFDGNGNAIWARNFGSAQTRTAAMYAIAVDAGNNVFVTGYFDGGSIDFGNGVPVVQALTGSFNTTMVVARFNADGTAAWAKGYGGNGASTVGRAVTLDTFGDPVFLGQFSNMDIMVDTTPVSLGPTMPANTRSAESVLIVKVDRTNGTASWATSSTGAGTVASGRGLGIAANSSGTIFASGYFTDGDLIFGNTTLTRTGTSDLWLAAFDSSGTLLWARNYGGANVTAEANVANLVVDSNGDSHLAGYFHGGAFDIGLGAPLTWNGGTGSDSDIVIAKIDSSGDTVWARNWGTPGGSSQPFAVARDTGGNIYFSGMSNTQTLTLDGMNLGKQGTMDIVLARLDSDGNTVWAARYGGTGASAVPMGLAVRNTSTLVTVGYFYDAPITIGTFTLDNTVGANTKLFIADIAQGYPLTVTVNGSGTVTSTPSGISCNTTCSSPFAANASVTLTASGGTLTAWSGGCGGSSATTSVTMNAAQSCTATFGSGPAPTPAPAPPAPPPSFVSTANPPPAVINADTTGSGQGTVSFASSFANPSSLSFTAAQTSGAALPAWLTFDPATVSFSYDVPLPSDLPIQPSADPSARAARSTVNTVYPLAVLVQTIPVNLTASGNGQSYTAAITMDFYAPRSPVAMTAISYGATGISGNAASSRPALSWDGGQVVFETTATNINPAAGNYSSIARYHGLSGKRDLLSQTAIPGGGVANGADGNSNNPAVAPSGSHAAFSSVAPGLSATPTIAPGLSATPNNRLRQVYRTGLAFPRVPLDEAATPAAILVSSTAAGLAADAAADMPALSEHGTFIAFESAAGNLGHNPDRLSQIWRKDAGSGAIILVSSAADGTPGNGDSRNVALSWDGNFAVFDSTATNLATGGIAGRQIYLKNVVGGQIYRLGAGSNPKLDARATGVVYVSTVGARSQVMRYDIVSGATTIVSATPAGVAANGDSTQAAPSADGRFVVFRSTATDLAPGYTGNGKSQVWIRDVMRGVTALVTQTEGGAAGGGDSSDPALSGDGSTVAFATQARDLVNGKPLPGQIHLAANPLVLPGRTAYWYAPDGGNLAWSVERWGDKALVAGLLYGPDGGTAMWVAGNCIFTGLTCRGTVSQWSGQGSKAAAVGPVTMTFAADGRSASITQGNAAARNLVPYPVGGSRTTGYAGLPQSGYWGMAGNAAGVSSLFIDTDTQVGANGAVTQASHMTLFGYDAAGNPEWYAALGPITADRTFAGQLFLHAGGSSWSQGSGTVRPSTTLAGTLRVNFTASDRATVQLPDGRIVEIQRWRF